MGGILDVARSWVVGVFWLSRGRILRSGRIVSGAAVERFEGGDLWGAGEVRWVRDAFLAAAFDGGPHCGAVEGWDSHLDNLQLLCAHCNSLKGDRPMEYLRARLVREYV